MALIDKDQISALPTIEEGDAGVILKKDGTFQVFNCHATLDPKHMTELQIDQGRKLLGISAALKLPQLMDVLLNVANDRTIFDQAVELPAAN